ncbi:hypothetical protein P2318_04620 [Myxococcaceae bacterium GXIMD 01537]
MLVRRGWNVVLLLLLPGGGRTEDPSESQVSGEEASISIEEASEAQDLELHVVGGWGGRPVEEGVWGSVARVGVDGRLEVQLFHRDLMVGLGGLAVGMGGGDAAAWCLRGLGHGGG